MIDFQRHSFLRLLMAVSLVVFIVGGVGCSGENSEKMFQQGVDAVTADKLDEAVIWFKKALQQNPEMAMAHYKLGEVYRKKGDVKLAYSELSRAVQQEPQLKDARKELAFLLVENRAVEQAVKVCEQFLAVNGNDEDIYLILGNALAYTKRTEKAVEVLEKGQKLYPESVALQINYARILFVMGDIEEARSIMEALALKELADIRVQLALAKMYEKMERFDLAGVTLEAVKEKFPESPFPYLVLAQLSLKQNQPDKAKRIILDAEKTGVKDSLLYRLYAMISHRQGDSDSALKYYEKAVEVATDETRQSNQMILADYHSYLKNYKEAQKIFESIIAEDSSKKRLKSKVVALFMAQGKFDQARASVDVLLKEDSSDARGHFLSGLMMMQDKEVAEARKAFSRAKDLAPKAAENQFMYGMTFMNESELISITEISEALKKNPNLLKARFALAEIYARKGEFQQSLDELDKILAKQGKTDELDKIDGKHADDIMARVLRVAVLLKMKNPGAALVDAKLLVEKQPDVSGHRYRLAEIYTYMAEYDKALALYEKLQEEKPDSAHVLNKIVGMFMLKKEHEKAMVVADSFLTKYPNNSAAVLVKAKIYLSQGDVDLAENVLMPEVAKGRDAAPIVMLAELYKNKNEPGKAIEYFQKALTLAPDNIGIMMKLADLYLEDGKNAEAIASYEEVLKQKKDFLPAMNNLAYLYGEEGGDLNRALDYANEVYRKLPENPNVADTLGWIYVMKNVYSQAEPYLQQALGEKPENPFVLYHMAMLRYGQKQQQEAETLLTMAMEKGLSGSDLTAAKETLAAISLSKEKLLVAKTQKEQGDVEQAILLFEEIMENEGFNSEAAAELAVLYAEQNKDMSRAVELARKAYAMQPSNPQIADALGWVYYHQGSFLLAKQYLEQAVKNDGGYARAHIHLGAMYLKKGELADGKKELETAKSMQLAAADLRSVEAMLREIEALEK